MGIAVAGATYSVNIELNHKAVSQQVDKINQDVKKIGKDGVLSSKKKNKVDKEGERIGKYLLSSEKQKLRIATSRQKVNTRIVKLEDKGLNMDRLRKHNQKEYYSMSQLSEAQAAKQWKQSKVIVDSLSLEVRKSEDKLARQNAVNAAKQKELNMALRLRRLGDSAGTLATRITSVNRGNKVGPGGGSYGLPSSSMLNAESRGIQNLNKVGTLEVRRLRRMKRMLQLEKEMTIENKKRNNMARNNVVGPGGINYGKGGGRAGLGAIKDFRRGQVLQSAVISGAFPLLFGQGPVTAAAGALGGGLGAKYGGQMGGFAGGLGATSAVTAIGQAVNATKELGQAMGPYTKDVDALVTATGSANSFRAKEIELLKEYEGEAAAFEAAMKDMTMLVGERGVEALRKFGEDMDRAGDDFQKLMTRIQAAIAGVINWTGIMREGKGSMLKRAGKMKDPRIQELLNERDYIGDNRGEFGGFSGQREALLQNEKDLRIAIADADKKLLDQQDDQLTKAKERYEAIERLNDLYKDIGSTIKDGLVQGIQAAIDGTKSLGEIAGSVFKKISNALLDFGVSMLLQKLPIPGASKFFGGGKAAGGPVKSGKGYLVGEKGPELFTPSSSGRITPNNKLGGANIVVNVDASGSSVEGDEGQSAQLGNMLAQAIQSELVRQKRPGGLLAV